MADGEYEQLLLFDIKFRLVQKCIQLLLCSHFIMTLFEKFWLRIDIIDIMIFFRNKFIYLNIRNKVHFLNIRNKVHFS